MLVNGQWSGKWDPVQSSDDDGRFIRQASQYRSWITPNGEPGPTGEDGFIAEPDRYHLYVALICPWASRALAVRSLKQLQDIITVSVVEPVLTEQGWRFGAFPGADRDAINGARYLHEIYTRADPGYTGRATVPVLWDKQRHAIVNNESADIMRMLNQAFNDFTDAGLNLYPYALRRGIDALNARLYTDLNNGVYQAGFASSQRAYEDAHDRVFGMLDELESRLADGRRFLFGDALTESDIRLFVTLVRFDAVYHDVFKCNRNLVAQMPALYDYLQRMLDLPAIRETVDPDHIKAGYYSIEALNPTGVVPAGPRRATLLLSQPN